VTNFETDDGVETYIFTCESNGVTTTRMFSSDNLHGFAFNVLQFTNQVGYTYVDMVEFSDDEGDIYRAENL
jgi:hypothetical protein